MGVKRHRYTGRKRGIRASPLLRTLLSPRSAVSLFAAFLLLINAAVPYWHAAEKAKAWAAAFSQPADKHQAALDAGMECPLHSAGGAAKQSGGEKPLSKKSCPLCEALQLFSPGVAQLGFSLLPCTERAVAVLVSHGIELEAPRAIPEQGRPRAPPLA